MFLKFLHHPQFPQQAVWIYQAHPALKNIIETNADKSENAAASIIKNYILEFNNKNQEAIGKIISEARLLLSEKSGLALQELVVLMDYTWRDDDYEFIAIPTILPFCPFNKNVFYFSIINIMNGKSKIGFVLFTAIHEISHYILHKTLESQKINSDPHTLYFLQEILAPVLMNQQSLVNIIHHDFNNYWGNTDIANLFITTNGNSKKIPEAFRRAYDKLKTEGKKFTEILFIFVDILNELQDELMKKKAIWDKYGHKIFDEEQLKTFYQRSMHIGKYTEYFA